MNDTLNKEIDKFEEDYSDIDQLYFLDWKRPFKYKLKHPSDEHQSQEVCAISYDEYKQNAYEFFMENSGSQTYYRADVVVLFLIEKCNKTHLFKKNMLIVALVFSLGRFGISYSSVQENGRIEGDWDWYVYVLYANLQIQTFMFFMAHMIFYTMCMHDFRRKIWL